MAVSRSPVKKVLFIAYYFPPINASGAFRSLGFCRYLGDYGWEPRVLAVDPKSVGSEFLVNTELCSQLPAALRVTRIGYTDPSALIDRAWACVRKIFPGKVMGSDVSSDQLKSNVRRGGSWPMQFLAESRSEIERLLSFPDPQRFWQYPAVRVGMKLMKEQPPSIVFATGKPWSSFLVGRTLARRFSIPLVVDFRDPWTRNPYAQSVTPRWRAKAGRIEEEICAGATRVVTTTPELREQFKNDYPGWADKFVTITNGFDDQRDLGSQLAEQCYSREASLELCHFGTLYGQRDPMPLLLAVRELVQQERINRSQLRINFIGDWLINDQTCNLLAQELEGRGLIRRVQPVARETGLSLMRTADALLVIQPASPLQVPAKIYEYVASGRPMLVIGGEGATASLVEGYQLGHCYLNNVAALKALLSDLISGVTELTPPQTKDTACFHYRNLTAQLANLFDSVLSE